MVTALSATVGGKVAKGDKLATLEAMKLVSRATTPGLHPTGAKAIRSAKRVTANRPGAHLSYG